jgi:hypothetical protein
MTSKKVLRYYTDCGRGFWSKKKALTHEINCKCWKNPKFKTCLSCKFQNIIKDNNGMEPGSQFYQQWEQNDCKNPEMNLDTMFTPAHENAPEICINCQKWTAK